MSASPFDALWHALAPAREAIRRRDDLTVARQVQLATTPAPTGDEGPRGRWIATQLRAAGLRDVTTDAAGNVRAWHRVSGSAAVSARAVVVCAHLDTVFPRDMPHVVARQGARYVGPGIGDNARGLSAMLTIAEAVAQCDVPLAHDVCFAATTGEEGDGDLRGARHLFATLEAMPIAAVILDGPGDDRLVHEAVGARRFRIAYHGPGGHSWADAGTPSAVQAAARCAARLAVWPVPAQPRTTLGVARIGGGTAINAVAADAWLEVDVRSTSGAMLERLEREVRRLAQAAADQESARRPAGTPALTVRVDLTGSRPAGAIDGGHALVRAAQAATRAIGRTPVTSTASTDANVPLSVGIPAVAMGAGGAGGGAHTPQEWYENREGARGVERGLGVIVAAARGG